MNSRTSICARRRRDLMQLAEPNSVIIVASAQEIIRNGDSYFPFRQDSDFLYLTGFNEPAAVLVLASGRDQGEQILFCRELDAERERWDGARLGLEGARDDLGFDDAFPIGDLDEILPGLMENREHIYHAVGRDPAFDRQVIGWRQLLQKQKRNARAPEELISLDHLLHELRLFKSSDELQAMRKAARISASAHKRAMQVCRPGLGEPELTAELMHEFTRNGCPPAYLPIVAGGRNALVLHYVANDQPLPDDGLVLIDAGCEFEGYAADISRTFPVSGRFSAAQRTIHDLVLAAQTAAIDKARPGNVFDDIHDAACRVLTAGLIDLGLLSGSVDDNLEQQLYRRFYMHKTGHWLGLDVHDVGDYRIAGRSRVLEKNMVTTVEPALYIGAEDDIPVRFRNIGVRIEDDIRITADAPENLSQSVPASADDIEALMQAGGSHRQ
ncbi:MAG: aminopeptidase P N-terminal domain-containing protein [Wenzhouxiangellaceae bacterium]|nr:aminopeptidase P N-terminal domain-containing protein [Wenzhouxiangellaceae bacterium]